MAEANPRNIDNFELEWGRVIQNIQTQFGELVNCLKTREEELLKEMNGILANYHSYRTESDNVKKKKIEIEKAKIYHQNELASTRIKFVHENVISQLNTEIKAIETPIEPKMISFECDSNKMLAELNKFGELVDKMRNEIDYKSKKQLVVSVCEQGNGMEQLNRPRGVTVDNKTGNIYIADQDNHCVKVFDSTCIYLFKFGDNEDEGNMHLPLSVAICGDRILISQTNNIIQDYQLNGKFISKIGKFGEGELEFNRPISLIIDESIENIYVSDYYNNRIQVLSQKFRFISQFGKGTLEHPRDVKLTKEYIYVLDESNPCLHIFNYNNILQKSVISLGKDMEVINPNFFFIDQTDYFVFSDFGSSSIRIFNHTFETFHTIFVSGKPVGITVDHKGRIIVVCQVAKNCLQIF